MKEQPFRILGPQALSEEQVRAWLARYLDRELDAEECARFEACLLQQPALLAEAELDTGLRQGFHLSSLRDRAPVSSLHGDGGDRLTRRPRRSRHRRPPWQLVACLTAGLGLGWLLGQQAGGQETPNATFVGQPGRIVFDHLRGSSAALHIESGHVGGPVLVELPVAGDSRRWQVQVGGTGFAYRMDDLRASADGFVSILLPRSALGSWLEIHAQDGSTKPSRRFELPHQLTP